MVLPKNGTQSMRNACEIKKGTNPGEYNLHASAIYGILQFSTPD